jgi:hypothetical protein
VRGGVSAPVFSAVLSKLERFDGWTWRRTVETTDTMYASGVRCTVRGDGGAPSYLAKQDADGRVDVLVGGGAGGAGGGGGAGVTMRISCNSEVPVPPPRSGDAVVFVRLKRRTTFNRKEEFLYDLTEVRSGETRALAAAAPPTYEVELEWCGQPRAAAGEFGAVPGGGAARLMADKFIAKVRDIAGLVAAASEVREGGRQAAAPPARGGGGAAGGGGGAEGGGVGAGRA